jgi:hypothetical protein
MNVYLDGLMQIMKIFLIYDNFMFYVWKHIIWKYV